MTQHGTHSAEERSWCVHLPAKLRIPTKIRAAELEIPMYDVIILALKDYLKSK